MVRVRFAPSPTGHLHQGNIRTALFNFLYVRQQGGEMVLRIDDTDPERSKPEYEEGIIKDLKWLGISFEEGPDLNGGTGPYRQSERKEIYREYFKKLKETGKIYPCFNTPEEIEAERRKALATGKTFCFRSPHRDLTPEEVTKRIEQGERPHYRFAVEREIIKFTDLVYGEKVFDTGTIGDFTVARADESLLYLFASAVDDCLMKITHVIRGEDGMSNTPRQILIQRALGLESPQYAHLPLILGPDHTMLSKRNGSATVSELKDQGYLPEAVLNYLALLGWAPPAGREILPLEELIRLFQIKKVSRSSAIFDWDKLNHVNAIYLRRLEEGEYLSLANRIVKAAKPDVGDASEDSVKQTLIALRPNIQNLGELPEWLGLLLGVPQLGGEAAQEVLKVPETSKVLQSALPLLEETTGEFNENNYKEFIESLKKKSKIKGKKLMMPLRVSLTGSTEGPELVKLFSALGKNKVLERVKSATENLQHQESN